jgi:hypothetical protein
LFTTPAYPLFHSYKAAIVDFVACTSRFVCLKQSSMKFLKTLIRHALFAIAAQEPISSSGVFS